MATPVVFVHGLWLHATSWNPWIERFREAGYDPVAPGWPGERPTVEETRRRPEKMAATGIDDVVHHYTAIIAALPEQPVVIGHSFGGLVAQKLLGQGLAAAAVAIDSAPVKGVLPMPRSTLRATSSVLRNPSNRKRLVSLTAEQFRYGFGNALTAEKSDELHARWTMPSPGRPLFQAALANLNPRAESKVATLNARRGPLLLISGGQDHTVPPVLTRANHKLYETSSAITELLEFPDRGHSLTVDDGWDEIATASLDFLQRRLTPVAR